MYTLKGIFPEPSKYIMLVTFKCKYIKPTYRYFIIKDFVYCYFYSLLQISEKEQKKNFIKENMKQLKLIQNKSPKEPKLTLKSSNPSRLTTPVTTNTLGPVRSSPSNKSGKATLNVGKTSLSNRKKLTDVRIKKGDMAEFLRRKEIREAKQQEESSCDEIQSSGSSSRLRDIGCQTIESNLAQKLTESTKLTMLYPTKEGDDTEAKMKASGDSRSARSPPPVSHSPRRAGDDIMDERNRSRLNAILDRKDSKDPYLPPGIVFILIKFYHIFCLLILEYCSVKKFVLKDCN